MTSFINKIIELDFLLEKVAELRKEHKKIVFTNGCFDILHLGHATYLEQAKQLGDFLIIGVNSDNSVRKLKGLNRPINDLQKRMGLLAALSSVDAVICFEDETPLNLIKAIKPNVIAKGGDWSIDQIVGADIAVSNGGQVISIPLISGISTTIIENKILKSKDEK